MRIGILEADKLDAKLVAQHGSYADMFKNLLSSIDNEVTFNTYSVIDNAYPEHIDTCDAYLITGSKYGVYDSDDWIRKLQAYIVSLHERHKKLVGICFGHQLIAQALGGKVSKSKKGWGVGNINTNIIQTPGWMQTNKQQFTMIYSHQDQVDILPDEATLIARSDFCPLSSFQIGKHILTFQGHPEFTAAYARQRLEARREKVGETTYQEGMASLRNENDSSLVARWIIDFSKLNSGRNI